MLLFQLFAVISTFIFQVSSCENLPSPPSQQDVESFVGRQYDYLIIGGGTAGLVVASRLAERTPFQIGVVEAGSFYHNDPNVDVPSNFPLLAGPQYDWGFNSSPQLHAGMRNISIPRGKMLGGSSGRNQMAFNRGSSTEYDAWSLFGQAQNWTWDHLLPYFRLNERTSPTDPFARFSQGSNDLRDELHGFLGPIAVSMNELYSAEIPYFIRTLNQLGIKTNVEADHGRPLGVYNAPLSVDRTKGVRSYAANEFYCNQPERPNLHILTGAQATRILFSKGASKPVATGAEFFVSALNQYYNLSTTKEVILSAGAVQTPQLLELSGIGNSTLLRELQIPVIVDNPAVGENLQEHLFVLIQFELINSLKAFDTLRKNATFMAEQQAVYNSTHSGFLAALDSTVAYIPLQTFVSPARIKELLSIVDAQLASVNRRSLTALQYELQRDWLQSGNVSFVELIAWSRGTISPEPDKSYLTILGGIMHPMSRGSVHIESKNPLLPPKIDPAFLTSDFDIAVLRDAVKFIQKIGREPPFATIVTSSNIDHEDDSSLQEYIRNTSGGGSHLIGTAALGPMSMGGECPVALLAVKITPDEGVVDSSLQVHGALNLRIVDASIFPNQVSAHTQATVYAVAEAAADQIAQHSTSEKGVRVREDGGHLNGVFMPDCRGSEHLECALLGP